MPAYSIADAKTHLTRLIDQAQAGHDVVITRNGRPVAELRAMTPTHKSGSPATYLWLTSRRNARAPARRSSVDLLNHMYDPPA